MNVVDVVNPGAAAVVSISISGFGFGAYGAGQPVLIPGLCCPPSSA